MKVPQLTQFQGWHWAHARITSEIARDSWIHDHFGVNVVLTEQGQRMIVVKQTELSP